MTAVTARSWPRRGFVWLMRALLVLLTLVLVAFAALALFSRVTDKGLPTWDLRSVEAKGAQGDVFYVLYSGDGGWAPADKAFYSLLAQRGLPVVGVDVIRYFLLPRSPRGAAADLTRIIDVYSARWGKSKVVLMGYSFGASALPIIAAELPARERAMLKAMVLASPGVSADMELQPMTYAGKTAPWAIPIEPALRRLAGLPIICIYAVGDPSAVCPRLPAGLVRVRAVPGGHRFTGEYAAVADIAAEAAAP